MTAVPSPGGPEAAWLDHARPRPAALGVPWVLVLLHATALLVSGMLGLALAVWDP